MFLSAFLSSFIHVLSPNPFVFPFVLFFYTINIIAVSFITCFQLCSFVYLSAFSASLYVVSITVILTFTTHKRPKREHSTIHSSAYLLQLSPTHHQQHQRMAAPSSSNWVMETAHDVPHVLAVDDNLIDRKLVEKLLRNSSCKVTTAENGPRALELLGLTSGGQNSMNGRSKVNLVITDYCMPGMTGYELLKKIKESSVMKEVPVVIMSSENIPTRINKCLEEGAQMFILKPLKQSDVKKLTCQLMN